VPAPTTTADSYATSMSVRLTVAAPGVLDNDTGDVDIAAALVPDSAAHGVAVVFPDGSFTFDPTPGFVGTATFQYTATDGGGTSAATLVTITVGDCVEWAHLTSAAEGQMGVEGEGRGRTTWQVRADRRNRTPVEVLASPKLPQRGDPLRRFKLTAGAYTITRSYETDGAEATNDNVVVVLVEAKQHEQNPWLWAVTVSYEGKDDPTAELPEVTSHETEYQDYRTADIHGRLVANSAVDPFEGGMPVDEATDSLVITRNLPFGSWDTERKRGYRNTLNLLPFRLGNQVDENGDPIDLPPGVVRLKRITEQRMVRSKAATVAAAKFYWRVTAELVMDNRVYRTYGTDGLPVDNPVKHRWVVPDAGYNTLSSGTRTPILFGGQRPTDPQLLNGSGGLLTNPSNVWPAATVPGDAPDVCAATNKTYAYPTGGGALTVAAPGLLADCYSTTGDTADLTAHLVGSVTGGTLSGDAVGADGAFTFTKTGGFSGYASFKYRVKAGGVDATYSAAMTVVIFCGVTPVMLAFERYPYKDWSDLSALLEGW
jgi:hypothetical protein